MKGIHGFDVFDLTAQQKGLNEFSSSGYERYARVIINTTYGNTGDYENLNFNIEEITQSDKNELNIFFRDEMQNSFSANGLKLVEWYPLKVEKINGMSCFHISYVRQIQDNPVVIVHGYLFQNNDRIYNLTLSYRISESNYWASDFDTILKSFRITDVR